MAQRRMFSRKITESDSFLDLPMSSQCLYFHINMSADDDGFVGNAKTIKRMIGASDDDLRILLQKEFIIPFESGVVVVKDWKIHNYIRKDRYQETFYKLEKSQLEVDSNNVYQVGIPSDIPTVDQMDTQVRLGKDRLGKDRLTTTTTEKEENKKNDTQPQKVVSGGCCGQKEVLTFYQNNIGQLNPYMIDTFADWCSLLSPELAMEAIKIAIENNKPNLSYISGILKNWLNRNVKTLSDVKALNAEFENKKQSKNYQRPQKQEVTPEWLKNQPQEQQDDKRDLTEEQQRAAEELKRKLKGITNGK